MRIILLLIVILSPCFSMSQNYPNIDPSIRFEESDFSEIDELIKEEQPNKAIVKLLVVQLQAINQGNLLNLRKVHDRMLQAIVRSGKENEDIQKLFFEQHKLFLLSKGATKNLSARMLFNWLDDYRFRRCFSFDDESLAWPLFYRQAKTIVLKNQNIEPLRAIYAAAILENPDALMRISSSTMFKSEEVKYQPTLFDVFAHERIGRGNFLDDSDDCNWKSTEAFASKKLNESQEIQAQLEILNKRHKRWDAYAFNVENRLKSCDFSNKEKEFLNVLTIFQKELRAEPASNRFAYAKATLLANKAGQYSWTNQTEWKDGFVEALGVIGKALADHPKSDFTADFNQLKEKILESSSSFELVTSGFPQKGTLLKVDYRNLDKAHLVIYKVQGVISDKIYERNQLKRYELQVVAEHDLTFNTDEFHGRHSKDFILKELNNSGKYLLVLTETKEDLDKILLLDKWNNETKINYQVIQLSKLVVRHMQNDLGYDVLVNDAKTGKPISGAEVEVLSRNSIDPKTLLTGETDENGKFSITNITNFIYVVRYNEDEIRSSGYYHPNSEVEYTQHQVYTDRSIYRPGQTVFFKTLTFEKKVKESQFVSGKKITVVVKDQNSNEVYSTKLICNEFGSATGSFALPKKGILLGELFIYVDGRHVTNIRVEEYKRPTFEIIMDQPKGRVALGSPVELSGKVLALAGYPLSNAEVEITVEESRFFPRWCIVVDEWRNYDTSIVVKTDENGVFNFSYTSQRPKEASGVYYHFGAKAIDLSGEVQTANSYLYIGKEAYSISADLKEKYTVDEEPQVVVEVLNSQQEKQANVAVDYSILRKNQDNWYVNNQTESEFKDFSRKKFKKHFPKTRYYSDQIDELEELAKGNVKSGETINIVGLPQGTYQLKMSTVDEMGDTVQSQNEFVVWNPESKFKQHLAEFWVENVSPEAEIGQEAELIFGSSYRKALLMIATYNEGGLINLDYRKLKRRKTISFPLNESHKNGLGVYASIIKKGKVINETILIQPKDTIEELKMKLKSIQEPLRPGTNQSWELEITQNGKSIKNAELLANMYDASLDAFRSHHWQTNLISKPYINMYWSTNYQNVNIDSRRNWEFPHFPWNTNFGKNQFRKEDILMDAMVVRSSVKMTKSNKLIGFGKESDAGGVEDANYARIEEPSFNDEENSENQPVVRENFNETAFFEPQIHVSTDGKYNWRFTLPDALTRWKFMAFAHQKDFQTVYLEKTFQARKELMLETFEPRFWRKGDTLAWVGKVVNLSEKEQVVTVSLKIQNLLDEKDVSDLFGQFAQKTIALKPNESKAVEWQIVVPQESPTLLRFEAEASTNEFSDIVRKNMPVLENRERITLGDNFTIAAKGTHDLIIDDLANVSDKAELIHYSVNVQKQPLWTTMLSLTSLFTPTNELNESFFNQYYAAALAKNILKQNPKMKQVLSAWNFGSEDALTSVLEQNDALKALVLAETPWALEAKSETERLRKLSQLLDDAHLTKIIEDGRERLHTLQMADGSWSWVGTQNTSWYITQRFAAGLAELQNLGIGIDIDDNMIRKALEALDANYKKQFDRLSEKDRAREFGLSNGAVEWLFIRQSFQRAGTDASKYYSSLLRDQWQKFGLNAQAKIGQIALMNEDESLAKRIMASFQDKARNKKGLGKYWNTNRLGYGWYENNIETQSDLIAFYEKYGEMNESAFAMKLWLLQQKRTQMWDSPKSTAKACYALRDFGNREESQEVTLRFPGEEAVVISEAKPTDKVVPADISLELAKKGAELSTSSDDLVFASAQLVYSDEVGRIAKTTGDFRMERNYYVMKNGEEVLVSDENKLRVGDIVKVKLKLITDRELDFVYLEDPKAAGWEPLNALSGYHYENGYYYLSNRDSKTEIFIEKLRKGTYLYTYDMKVTVKGSLQVGPAKASCYYAPSFSSNTSGERMNIEFHE